MDLNVRVRGSSTSLVIQKVGILNYLYFTPKVYKTMQIIAKMYDTILKIF